MARSVRGGFQRGAVRLTEWDATVPESAFQGLAANTAVLDSTFATVDAETIIRTRGLLTVRTDQVSALEDPFGAVGMCVVSDQAVAIGVTAIPTPYTDAESDLWLFHSFWAAPITLATGAAFANVSTQIHLESKAMRRINEDQTLCLVVENGSGTFGCSYRLDARILYKVS